MIKGGLIFLIFSVMFAGCSRRDRPGLDELYRGAESSLNSGNMPEAVRLAEQGRRISESTDPSWNWKFRILIADIHLWEGRVEEAQKPLDGGAASPLSPE